MTIFPDGFDPRADVVGKLDLVLINTPDGDFGFMLGVDGRFVDSNGRTWWGSQLITAGDLEFAINGTAPQGSLQMSFFQDPDADNLVSQIKALGVAYVEGREITFYEQYFNDPSEFYAPQWPPTQILVRRMRKITTAADGPQQRTIAVSFEGPFENRRAARRRIYNSEDHSEKVGSVNPSLNFIPRDRNFREKLFG